MRRFWAVMLFAVPACSGAPVRRDFNPDADFSRLRTYSWQTEEAGADSLMDARVRKAVDDALARRAYKKVPGGEAEFLVGYRYEVKKFADPGRVRTGVGVGVGTGGVSFGGISLGVGLGPRDNEEEFLAIDFLDPKTKKAIWQGSTWGKFSVNDPAKTAARVNKAVRSILSKFPPKEKR